MRSLAAVVTALLVVLGGGSLVASASAEEVNPWLDMRVMNMAHSGGEDEAPMNTLYAFKRAKALGADMLELDVQSTQDGRLAGRLDGGWLRPAVLVVAAVAAAVAVARGLA